MLEAVVFLKDLEERGLVTEVSRGIWLRTPVVHMSASNTPGVTLYCKMNAVNGFVLHAEQ